MLKNKIGFRLSHLLSDKTTNIYSRNVNNKTDYNETAMASCYTLYFIILEISRHCFIQFS